MRPFWPTILGRLGRWKLPVLLLLFDIPRFVRGLEEAFCRVIERSDRGLTPGHIVIADADLG